MNSLDFIAAPGIRRARSSLLFGILFLCSVAVQAQEMPDWLRNESSQRAQSDSTNNEIEKSVPVRPGQTDWSRSGPFIEETIVGPGGPVETVQERAMRRGISAPEPLLSPPEPDPRYLVQPSDVLVISVWREPDLMREVSVSPDGWISVPLAGELNVENQSLAWITDEIERALRKYIAEPVVNISLKQALGNRIYVLGNVNKPGVFPFSKNLDVVQALSLAGGISRFAAEDNIKVIRRSGENSQTTYAFNYSQVERGKRLEQNIILRSGDVVMVP